MMSGRASLGGLCVSLASLAWAGAFPQSLPENRGAAGLYSPRNLALGEPRFTEPGLYNLLDQGGSPMALLEKQHRLSASLGLLTTGLSTPGDTVEMRHGDYYLPQLGFYQPGVFGMALYYQRESESFGRRGGDSVETGLSRFGFDLAAGPSSGIVRVGFGAHAALGESDYPGNPKRILLGIPSLRVDLSSRPMAGLEFGGYIGLGIRFDSLENAGSLERVADWTLPRYGFLAAVSEPGGIPLRGTAVLEFGSRVFYGEYNVGGISGQIYPTLETHHRDFQTQWMYTHTLGAFRLGPALRLAFRSEEAQAYAGIRGESNPLERGPKLDTSWEHGVTAFGLGGNFSYDEMISLLLEWETAGHAFDSGTAVERRYHRFTLGAEHRVDKLPALRVPEGWALALRAGWTWREEDRNRPGYRDFHFDPFVPSRGVPTRAGRIFPVPGEPAGYSAFSLGFGLGLPGERVQFDALLSFPGQRELLAPNRSAEASGVEFGLNARVAL